MAQPRIQLGQRQLRSRASRACWAVTWLIREKQLVDCGEEPFDLPSATWLASSREDDGHVEVSSDLLEML